jgi:hypothetical protein
MHRRTAHLLNLLTVALIVAASLLAAQPRAAHAQFSDISLSAGYAFSTTPVNSYVPFSINATNSGSSQATTDFGIQFPGGATFVGSEAVGNGCSIIGGESGPSVFEAILTVPATPQGCAFSIGLKFSVPGVYDIEDHLYEAGSTLIFGNANITVTGDDTGGDPTPVPVTACAQLPDMAVSPELINLAPGGSATVEVALRNLCSDAPFNDSDLLVSLSDGLTVVDGSAGMLNLGQRAAWQGLSLAAGETRRWTLTVKAAETLSAAPQHISELYHRGRVANRIDGVFITPAPAPVVAAPAPAPAPAAAPAAPAPIPAALPNTAGEREVGTLLPLAALLLATLGGAALTLRRR